MKDGAREKLFAARAKEVLGVLALQWPSMCVTVDLWRASVLQNDASTYIDEAIEAWVRLNETVPAFFVQEKERWWSEETGLHRMVVSRLFMPEGLGLKADDHVILKGVPWIITEVEEEAGLTKVKIDNTKGRFVAPSRALPTYRQFIMKAAIL